MDSGSVAVSVCLVTFPLFISTGTSCLEAAALTLGDLVEPLAQEMFLPLYIYVYCICMYMAFVSLQQQQQQRQQRLEGHPLLAAKVVKKNDVLSKIYIGVIK